MAKTRRMRKGAGVLSALGNAARKVGSVAATGARAAATGVRKVGTAASLGVGYGLTGVGKLVPKSAVYGNSSSSTPVQSVGAQGQQFANQMAELRGALEPIGAEAENWKGGTTRRNKTSGGDIVTHLLTIRNQVKLYHWQTKQFARHKATDDLTAVLDTNIDAFVESYMGRYGRPSVSKSIKLHNFSESAAKSFVAKETKYLERELPKKIGKNDTDLLNLRDTILGDLTKVSYLFTLA